MRSRFSLLCAVLLSYLPMFGEQDARVTEALYRVSREASQLWQTAPGFIGRETIHQKALSHPRSRVRVGASAVRAKDERLYENHELVSFYGLGAFKGAPEALHEFREIYELDGKPVAPPDAARARFASELTGGSDQAKQELLRDFEKKSGAGAALDFGQLLLLFTKPNLAKYSFEFAGDARLGVDTAWLILFTQQAGSQSLHLAEGRKKSSEKLRGEIWVRQGDYLPLRIVLTSTRTRQRNETRDEAKLDYTVVSGALLPAALVHRRFFNDELVLENIYRYSDWRPVKAP